MRCRAISVVALLALTACDGAEEMSSDVALPSVAEIGVDCADAAQLRQRAIDDHRQSAQTKSDQQMIVIRNRASFFASLAVVADLKCRVTSADVDEALKPALEAARQAESSSSFYDGAQWWSEAHFNATQVIGLLIQQLPDAQS